MKKVFLPLIVISLFGMPMYAHSETDNLINVTGQQSKIYIRPNFNKDKIVINIPNAYNSAKAIKDNIPNAYDALKIPEDKMPNPFYEEIKLKISPEDLKNIKNKSKK